VSYITIKAYSSHSYLQHITSVLVDKKLFVDTRLLNQRVQDVENTVAAPNLRVITKQSNLLFRTVLNSVSAVAERLELVDEFINDVPQPLVGKFKVDREVGICRVID
jgi:hypothetical protein